MDWFELMSSEHFHVILHSDKKHGLIFNRIDGTVATINHDDAKELSNLRAKGRIYGIVGHYLNRYLVLIKNRTLVGSLYEPHSKTEHKVYVITQVQVIDVLASCTAVQPESNLKSNSVRYDAAFVKNDSADLGISNATTKGSADETQDAFSSLPITISTSSYASMQSRSAPWNPFKLANSLRPMMPSQFLRSSAVDTSIVDTSSGGPSQPSSSSQAADDSDKRLVEEMTKLFNNTNSFYFSPTLDLTNRFSRKSLVKTSGKEAIWKTADERFFWNKYMLKDLIELSENDNDANYFICVILQGFIAIEDHTMSSYHSVNSSGVENGLPATSVNMMSGSNRYCDSNRYSSVADYDDQSHSTRKSSKSYQLALVSRRSVFQAGTRYRRRGCDEEGNCANFVETEQIFRYSQHFTSVVMLRGSIPLYWYQTGYNYRPPPVLYRSEDENHAAFTRHFSSLIKSYETDQIISVDCTEHCGREKILHDAFKKHMEKLRSSTPNLRLIEFDFHKHCRGRQCSDIQVEKHLRSCGLTEKLVKDLKYYWNDGDVVWNQMGVFRVNCLDCSDRTNVVQRAIALQILDIQLARLGVIAPDTCPEDNECRRIMQMMWSTNGNVLSTQYCGTRALFTGDRKLSGYLKDTYSSASRYYIGKFRDAYRQAAIDAMLGVDSSIKDLRPDGQKDQNPGVDQYELINLDPIFTARSGGELLKDVGNRVSNRLARLKGKFYVRPFGTDNMRASGSETDRIDETDPDIIEERTDAETLSALNIDWPSSESVDNNIVDNQAPNLFARMSHSDDSFQDDEFGQLMLSVDLSELQRLRDDEFKAIGADGPDNKDKKQSPEEIDMTETGGLKTSSSTSENLEVATTSTTST